MPSCCWSWVGVVVLVLTWSEFVCVRVVAEDPGCLCLTSDGGALDSYKFNGQLFYNDLEYPNDYGALIAQYAQSNNTEHYRIYLFCHLLYFSMFWSNIDYLVGTILTLLNLNNFVYHFCHFCGM
jgi:hypothetical protein